MEKEEMVQEVGSWAPDTNNRMRETKYMKPVSLFWQMKNLVRKGTHRQMREAKGDFTLARQHETYECQN